jgi:hypothetical protein
MTRRHILGLLLALSLLLAARSPAFAFQSDPAAKQGERVAPTGRYDLAAMALGRADVPSDFSFSYGVYFSKTEIASQLGGGGITPADLDRIGLRWYYESRFASSDGQSHIQTYLEEFDSSAAATRGFGVLEDESLVSSSDRTSVDQPGLPGIGEEPSEVTVGTQTASDGTVTGQMLDATFRLGRMLVGVSISTSGTQKPDEQTLTDLAKRAEQRVNAVLDGTSLPGIDTSIPPLLLGFESAVPLQESYVGIADIFGPTLPKDITDDYQSGYVRTVGLGPTSGSQIPKPLVTVTVARFGSEQSGLHLLSLRTSAQPPYTALTEVPVDRIPGATAVAGYSFANIIDNASPDSFRVVALVGTDMIGVEVQGASSVEIAESAAIALATRQIACEGAGTPCGTAQVPADLVKG